MPDRKPPIFPISSLGSNFNPQVSEVRDSEILNVFLRLKLSPTLNLKKFAGFRSDTNYRLTVIIKKTPATQRPISRNKEVVQEDETVALTRLIKKVKRNVNDYGLRITLFKIIASLLRLFYENRTYRIYMINLENVQDAPPQEDGFSYMLINGHDTNYIQQIEDIEEWLYGKIKRHLERGLVCLVALDGSTVAGFNLVALEEGELPLIHYKRKLRPHEAWSEQITVKKSYRGKRLASSLRARMFELLKQQGRKKFYGGAQTSNIASLKLARKVGFTEIADIQYRKCFTKRSLRFRRYKA